MPASASDSRSSTTSYPTGSSPRPRFSSSSRKPGKLDNPRRSRLRPPSCEAPSTPEPAPASAAPAAAFDADGDLLSQILGEPWSRARAGTAGRSLEGADEGDRRPLRRLPDRPETAGAGGDRRRRDRPADGQNLTSSRLPGRSKRPGGLFFLVRRLETDSKLTVSLIDISKAELAADLSSAEDPRATGFSSSWSNLRHTPGGKPWAILALDATSADRGRRRDLGRRDDGPARRRSRSSPPRARVAESLVRRHARPRRIGIPLRPRSATPGPRSGSRRRRYLALALPRSLLRLPYGTGFTSSRSPSRRSCPSRGTEDYLWGNPAFASPTCSAGLSPESGWELGRVGSTRSTDSRPHPTVRRRGRAKPCARRTGLTAPPNLTDRGLIPVLSVHNADSIRVASFLSVAEPPRRSPALEVVGIELNGLGGCRGMGLARLLWENWKEMGNALPHP